MRPILNYYGSKYLLAPKIIEKFPDHKIFVDLFCGSASILIRKPRARIDVVNDIDSRIYSLFKILQDKPDDLKALLFVTPYSREQYKSSIIEGSELQKARDLIVRSFMGIGDSIASQSNGFRNSKTSNTNPSASWRNWWDHLGETIDRFRGVIIENLDWQKCIDKYDSNDTLFYVDPPYIQKSRSHKKGYCHEFYDHDLLIERLNNIKGTFAYSCYEYKGLENYQVFDFSTKTQKNTRIERLVVKTHANKNLDPSEGLTKERGE